MHFSRISTYGIVQPMKSWFFLILFLLGALNSISARTTHLAQTPLDLDLQGKSIILMNAETGAILFEKNAHERRHPASITKIATALYSLEKNRNFLDSEVIAEQDSIGTVREEEKIKSNYRGPPYRLIVGGTHIVIKTGEILPLKALLYGMMLESGNDAANVIAQYTSGKINNFTQEMNLYLKEIGCKNTQFMNPSGVHHPDHKTTAYDMAIMARFALKDPIFQDIVKTTSYPRPKTNKQDQSTLVQHNKLLKKGPFYYEHAIGVKTGFCSNAGHNLVAAAKKNGRTLIAVTMGAEKKGDHYKDVIALFDWAFQEKPVKQVLLPKGLQKNLIPLGKNKIQVFTTEEVSLDFYPSETPKIQAWAKTIEPKYPIRKGDRIGEMVFSKEDQTIFKRVGLYAAEEVVESLVGKLPKVGLLVLGLGIVLAIFIFGIRRLKVNNNI